MKFNVQFDFDVTKFQFSFKFSYHSKVKVVLLLEISRVRCVTTRMYTHANWSTVLSATDRIDQHTSNLQCWNIFRISYKQQMPNHSVIESCVSRFRWPGRARPTHFAILGIWIVSSFGPSRLMWVTQLAIEHIFSFESISIRWEHLFWIS